MRLTRPVYTVRFMGKFVRGFCLLIVLLIAGCGSSAKTMTLPTVTLNDATWVEVSRNAPEAPAKHLDPGTDAVLIEPLLTAFNRAATVTHRDVAATPPVKVEIRLQNGESILLALSEDTKVMATVKGEALWITSSALAGAIKDLERTLP